MLSKAIVFVFSFLGIFTLLLGTFNTVPFPINEGAGGTPTEIRKQFDIANVTVYGSGGSDNMTYPYTSLTDAPGAPQWTTKSSGKYLEIWWGTWYGEHLQLRDAQMEWWGVDYHAMTLRNRQGQLISNYGYDTGDPENTEITAPILQATWEPNYDASYFEAKCDHLIANVLFTFNQTTYSTITDAYNAGYLDYSLTYGLDYNGTGLSAWSIVGSLLAFQAPNIGITGIGGTILSGIIAAPLIACVMYLAYKIITGIIPWVSGGSGD
jgi:hypothetical protein